MEAGDVTGAYIARRAAARAAPRAAQTAGRLGSVAVGGFYPQYDGANDQVDAVVPVLRTAFQRIIPRYELSGSETRDTGLGPTFYDVPVYRPQRPQADSPAPPASGTVGGRGFAAAAGGAPLYPWQGARVDILA